MSYSFYFSPQCIFSLLSFASYLCSHSVSRSVTSCFLPLTRGDLTWPMHNCEPVCGSDCACVTMCHCAVCACVCVCECLTWMPLHTEGTMSFSFFGSVFPWVCVRVSASACDHSESPRGAADVAGHTLNTSTLFFLPLLVKHWFRGPQFRGDNEHRSIKEGDNKGKCDRGTTPGGCFTH